MGASDLASAMAKVAAMAMARWATAVLNECAATSTAAATRAMRSQAPDVALVRGGVGDGGEEGDGK
eukprot:11415250-Alexandrium_andersonii.AAC.1